MEDNYMEGTPSFETILTHVTGVLFVLLGIATWTLKWLVNNWTARVKGI